MDTPGGLVFRLEKHLIAKNIAVPVGFALTRRKEMILRPDENCINREMGYPARRVLIDREKPS